MLAKLGSGFPSSSTTLIDIPRGVPSGFGLREDVGQNDFPAPAAAITPRASLVNRLIQVDSKRFVHLDFHGNCFRNMLVLTA